jgi:hypothetical protein
MVIIRLVPSCPTNPAGGFKTRTPGHNGILGVVPPETARWGSYSAIQSAALHETHVVLPALKSLL